MGKRGSKPKGKVKIEWSADFAYAIGLLVTDGCLSPDGRHITFVSMDEDQLNNFEEALRIKLKRGKSKSGYSGLYSPRVQFSDVLFYRFLLGIGLTPNKSKTIGEVRVPERYFFDFLRGVFDGDGSTYSYWDKRWRSSFMFYLDFASASRSFIDWLRTTIARLIGCSGHVTKSSKGSTYQLKYAKRESLLIIKQMYRSSESMFLARKRLKIDKMLTIVGEKL